VVGNSILTLGAVFGAPGCDVEFVIGAPKLIVNTARPITGFAAVVAVVGLSVAPEVLVQVTRRSPPPGFVAPPAVDPAVPSGPAPIGSVWPVEVPRPVGPKGTDNPHSTVNGCPNATLLSASKMPRTSMGMNTRLNAI